MKLSRQDIKEIVKECLLEILAEGVGVRGTQRVTEHALKMQRQQSRTLTTQTQPLQKKVHPLDQPIGNRRPSDALKEAIKREAGGNPLMEAILADTATTTLPNMLNGGDTQLGLSNPTAGVVPGAIGQTEQFSGAPEEIFGDASSRWANLAFETPRPGKIPT